MISYQTAHNLCFIIYWEKEFECGIITIYLCGFPIKQQVVWHQKSSSVTQQQIISYWSLITLWLKVILLLNKKEFSKKTLSSLKVLRKFRKNNQKKGINTWAEKTIWLKTASLGHLGGPISNSWRRGAAAKMERK